MKEENTKDTQVLKASRGEKLIHLLQLDKDLTLQHQQKEQEGSETTNQESYTNFKIF